MNDEIAEKMGGAIAHLDDQVRCIRLGTVSPSLIDTFKVGYYGQQTPIKHLAFTSSQGGLVLVKPYDISILGLISKTLKEAGFNAYLYSKEVVAVSIPPVCGEEKEKVKGRIRKLGEEARIAIRNIRKVARNSTKDLTEDEKKVFEKDLQELTDLHIQMVDEIVSEKLESI